MKINNPFIFATALLAASISPSALMANNIYSIDYVQNPGTYMELSVTGTIATDGALGNITRTDLAVLDLTVTTFNGTFQATQPMDLVSFNAFATTCGLYLGGSGVNNLTVTTDGGTGEMFQLFYNPTLNQDSIYVEDKPSDSYYYYGTSALKPISLDGWSTAPASLFLSASQSSASSASVAPEPGSMGMIALAGLALISASRILGLRRKQRA